MKRLLLILVFVLLLIVLTAMPSPSAAALALEERATTPPVTTVPKSTDEIKLTSAPQSTPKGTPSPTPELTPVPTTAPTPVPTPEPPPVSTPTSVPVSKNLYISDEDLNLLARLTYREAGNEPVYGQRLVIDTVLNRVDHWAFPNTIREVIYHKNQFSPVLSGSINSAPVLDSIIQLIYEELANRTNYDVAFFRADHYGPYGTPLFQVGGHYFCSYD